MYADDDDVFDKLCDETRARNGEGMKHYKIDVFWFYLFNIKIQGSEVYRFGKLTNVFQDVLLALPHSNVELEHLFSIVKKNKTYTRSLRKLDKTFFNILTVKSRYFESKVLCHKWKLSQNLTADATSAIVKSMNSLHSNRFDKNSQIGC